MAPKVRLFPPILLTLLAFTPLAAQTISPLLARGYTVLPEPQRTSLQPTDFPFGPDWHLHPAASVAPTSTAIETLHDHLQSRFNVRLSESPQATHELTLDIQPNSITPGPTQDSDHAAIAREAYRLELSPTRIRIIANAEPGLFYGVQTLLQLLQPRNGQLWLPAGEIVDWPDLQLRHIYWDDAHHLEHLSDLKAAVRQAAFFKINGFVIKLEGHFAYPSAPALVEPQALTPADLQDLTTYALRYHVQVIPFLDAPAHIAFILKHPEYAKLRAFPDSNYELCATNPASLQLLYGMYDDLLAANQGVHYFYLSTDEPYYIGLADNPQCHEAGRTKALGSVGKVLAEFVTQAAGHLHDRGREVIFWGEYPMKPTDIASFPSYLINGETYGEQFDPVYKAHGIRQMIYGSVEGEERLFPQYFLGSASARLHPLHETEQRVPDALAAIAADPARHNSDLLGLVIAGWGDMGLHPETFWLGLATVTAAGWHPSERANEATNAFYPLFYGPSIHNMGRVYQLLSEQAQTWTDTWDTVPSTARIPIWGDSDKIFSPPQPARDQTIPLPPVPSPTNLAHATDWSRNNAQRLRIAADALPANDELLNLLAENLHLAADNRYNLEVFLSIAQLCRQNLDLLTSLQEIDNDLAQAAAHPTDPTRALGALDRALATAQSMRTRRNAVLADAVATWYKTWLPRVEQANGRRFLHELDDVKDHLPDRTVDMTYLIYRELQLPLEAWYDQTESARNTYAAAHHLPARHTPLHWDQTH